MNFVCKKHMKMVDFTKKMRKGKQFLERERTRLPNKEEEDEQA